MAHWGWHLVAWSRVRTHRLEDLWTDDLVDASAGRDILLRSLSTVLFVTAAVGFAPGGRVHGALQLGVVEGIRGPVLGDLPGSTAGVFGIVG